MYIISKIYIKNAVKVNESDFGKQRLFVDDSQMAGISILKGKKLKSSNMKLMLVNLNFYNLLCMGHPCNIIINKDKSDSKCHKGNFWLLN